MNFKAIMQNLYKKVAFPIIHVHNYNNIYNYTQNIKYIMLDSWQYFFVVIEFILYNYKIKIYLSKKCLKKKCLFKNNFSHFVSISNHIKKFRVLAA